MNLTSKTQGALSHINMCLSKGISFQGSIGDAAATFHLDEDYVVMVLENNNHIASIMAMSYEEHQEFMILNVKYPHIDGCKDAEN